MSMKTEILTWAAALDAYELGECERAIELFGTVRDSSKILTNVGLIYAAMGELDAAVAKFQAATALDQYLAIAYFQCGVCNFLRGCYELALRDFELALVHMRGHELINYEQLGLNYTLYAAEILFNKGISLVYLGDVEDGLLHMEHAQAFKAKEEHDVIDDAIIARGQDYTVFCIPPGVLYRPSEAKLRNARARDYLGKALLVVARDVNEPYTVFTEPIDSELPRKLSLRRKFKKRFGKDRRQSSLSSLMLSGTSLVTGFHPSIKKVLKVRRSHEV